MTENQAESEDRFERFRQAFLRDAQTGAARSVEDYIASYPGMGNDIAREFVAWEGRAKTRKGYVGPYRIERELGRGGQAVVYLCDDEKLRRKVAVKVLLGLGGASAKMLQRFQREAEITSQLDHPGICALFESGMGADGIPWIAMRYIEGQPLSTIVTVTQDGRVADSDATSLMIDLSTISLDGEPTAQTMGTGTSSSGSLASMGRRDMDRLLEIIEKVARALHVAHESGIIHRDIKPGNIMITARGEPVVLDFGLASADEGGQLAVTRTGDLMGTPAYMSPEQLMAQRIQLDRRTDIWSLAVTLYECLTLKRPFESPSREGLYRQILTKEPEDPRRLNPMIPAELAIVIQTAMDKDPDRRYVNAEAFADDLRQVRQLRPIAARPVSTWLRMKRWAQRNPVLATSCMGLALALTIGLTWATLKNRELDRLVRDVNAKNAALLVKTEEAERNWRKAQGLADVKKLEEARAALDMLWPLGQELIPRIDAYREDYEGLAQRLPSHSEALAELEASARPYAEADRANDHAQAKARLAVLGSEAEELEATLDDLMDTQFDAAERRLEAIEAERKTLEASLSRRRSWSFDGEDADFQSWHHEVLSQLVADLRQFADPKSGVFAEVKRRRARSEEIARRSLADSRELWRLCALRVAKNAHYADLKLEAIEGLIPIGADPESGLEEFLHWATHASDHPMIQREANGRLPEMDGKTGIILVLLPGGTFTMGSTPDESGPNYDPYSESSETPTLTVPLDPFFIGKYELTRGQWERLSGARDPSFWSKANLASALAPEDYRRHPLEQASWLDCRRELARASLSLPTEAQWEYACRAGSDTPWSFGARREDFDRYANLADATYSKWYGVDAGAYEPQGDDEHIVTAPVGSFLPNAFGLHDLHGNVWEWCLDEFGSYDRPRSPGDGAFRARGTGIRLNRGGAFNNSAIYSRSASRMKYAEHLPSANLGCRAVRPLPRAD
ncbi:MAG: SUMF1/EgtB/PvdO family nonheme iron enzyme [Planctomycetes bacterium]|nr:SUMF1/EgtB/PvdO family nonheme iron enzyme [Planctomycetota bacterium]